MAVGLLVQFQQRAAWPAAEGCEAGTDTEEKENVKEMVAENDAPSTEVRRDGIAQAERNGSWIGFDGMARCS